MYFFSKNLKYLRDKYKLDQATLAEKLGKKGGSSVANWEKGNAIPPVGVLADLAHMFGIGLDDLMNVDLTAVSHVSPNITPIYNQLTPDRQTKVYKFATSQLDEQNEEDTDDDNVIDIVTGRATAAGNPINGDDQDGLATMERVSVTDIPHGTDEIVTVDGDSMEPYYPKYSQIFVHWQDTIEDGELAVVRVCDEGVTFKQIYLDDDEKKIILHSLNEKYDDREFDADEIHIIGKVLN